MKNLKYFGIAFLTFSVLSAFLIIPEVIGGAWLKLINSYWKDLLDVDKRMDLFGTVISAAGLGLISLSLWHAVSVTDSQEKTEHHRWLRYLLEEWHSQAMNAARHRWHDEGRSKIENDGIASSLTTDVFVIVNFFEKYGRLLQSSALDPELTKSVFGDYSAWYRDNFFPEVFSARFYDNRMRAIDRKKYIDYFLDKVSG